MSNTIIELKHSQVSGNVPTSLSNGEISINTYDGKIFYKNPSGTIETFDKYPGPSGLDGELQFNDLGVLGSSANLVFNKSTSTLTVGALSIGNLNVKSTIQNVSEHSNSAFDQANLALETANIASGKGDLAISLVNSINAFSVLSIPSSQNIIADSGNTTLNILPGSGIEITSNSETKTIVIKASAQATSLFVDGADFGTLASAVVDINDLGSITDPVSASINLGSLTISGIISPSALILPSYTVSTLPSANPAAQMVFVSDESGGAVIAFSDGTNWRRVTDRAIVT